MVTFVAGYIAGVFCAIVSHPADSIVSKLNANPGGGVVSAAKELGTCSQCYGAFHRLNETSFLMWQTFRIC